MILALINGVLCTYLTVKFKTGKLIEKQNDEWIFNSQTVIDRMAYASLGMSIIVESLLCYFFVCISRMLNKFTTAELSKVKQALKFYFTMETCIVSFWAVVSVLLTLNFIGN